MSGATRPDPPRRIVHARSISDHVIKCFKNHCIRYDQPLKHGIECVMRRAVIEGLPLKPRKGRSRTAKTLFIRGINSQTHASFRSLCVTCGVRMSVGLEYTLFTAIEKDWVIRKPQRHIPRGLEHHFVPFTPEE